MNAQKAVEIRGYDIGPINAKAGFTSDITLSADITPQNLIDMVERERPNMDIRPGMRHKYTPLRFDPATGNLYNGGRYLFDTWENVLDYNHYTNEVLEPEPGVKFWTRPSFVHVDKHYWRVTGAHDFKPLATAHHINRFERHAYANQNVAELLTRAWPAIRDDAQKQGLSSVWLMYQPEEKQIGIVTVTARSADMDPAIALARGLAALEAAPAVGRLLPAELGLVKLFDRTSLIGSSWLPWSRALGGAHSSFPVSPPHPLPQL